MLPVQLKRPSSNSGGRFELAGPDSDDQERAKAEARKKAFERYKAYMDKLKQEGKEMPAEKRSYFENSGKEIPSRNDRHEPIFLRHLVNC